MGRELKDWKLKEECGADVAGLLESGWLGVGYTLINKNNARKRAAYASDSAEEQQVVEAWVQNRIKEGYFPLLRYYMAKSPCRMADSEFGGPIVLRTTSLGYEVIVELVLGIAEPGDLPKTLLELLGSQTKLDAICESLHLEETCAEFALIADIKSRGGTVVFTNMMGINPESSVPLRPHPTRVVRKIGRNEPCPCSSGKKYKKCCGLVN